MGKTSMAMLMYNLLAGRFPHRAIVKLEAEDMGGKLTERLSGLLRDLGFQGQQLHDIERLQSQLHTFVKDRAVLLLVDNVCDAQQLDALLPQAPQAATGATSFASGSRVIITSRLASMPVSNRYKVGVASSCAQHYMHQSLCCATINGCLCTPRKSTHPFSKGNMLPEQHAAPSSQQYTPLLPQPQRCWHDA
jgi:hypothetical protein